MLLKPLLILFLSVLFHVSAKAQNHQLDSVATNLNSYGLSNLQSSLFVHFDKNIYTNSEQVWFTGYLLKSVLPLDNHHTLYISLVNSIDSTVVLQERFLIQDGFSFGSFNLPDSLLSGSYNFVVNTNIQANGKIEAMFIQPVSIISNTVNMMVPHFSLIKKGIHAAADNVLLKVLTSDHHFVENAEIGYAFGKSKVISHGHIKTNNIGEAVIPYPTVKIDSTNNILSVSIKKNKDKRHIKYDLPSPEISRYKVNFYPEGGYLVNGLPSRVGYEVRDLKNAPAQLKAYLFENDLPVDSFSTDFSGVGIFSILPKVGYRYSLRLISSNDQNQYELPNILNRGLVMTAADAVVDRDLRISLLANHDTKIYAVIHNGNEISLQSELGLSGGLIQKLRFNLDSVKPGLNKITILDAGFKPLAERLFFAHHDQLVSLNLKTDKSLYEKRDSVKLTLDYHRKGLDSINGFVSISCAQSNRFSSVNNKNIVDYVYLEKELATLPYDFSSVKIKDKAYLNKVFLIKGWRGYQWQQTPINDSIVFSSSEVKGWVSKGKSTIKSPMELHTIAKTNINSFSTDSSGKFTIPFSNLIIDDKSDVWLSMNARNPAIFSIKIDDPLAQIKTQLQQTSFGNPDKPVSGMIQDAAIKVSAGINLKEVVIAKKKDNFNTGVFSNQPRVNRCGDYVCESNILNCVNHAGDSRNRPAKPNGRYRDQDGNLVTYFGCQIKEVDANISIIKGIQMPKKFYKYDVSNMDEPINATTIYWNQQVKLSNTGKTPVSFNTGDLTGAFKIVVQGVTDGGVVYGEQEILVKSK
ncbi:hypothetical protein ACFE6N_18710 [Pedobacter sp. BG31]|uniref:hypothetical protein n=1 Tax=Pedobacter sp. BG31 TaxID=3349697 RepID=UPI0035F3B373